LNDIDDILFTQIKTEEEFWKLFAKHIAAVQRYDEMDHFQESTVHLMSGIGAKLREYLTFNPEFKDNYFKGSTRLTRFIVY